MQFCIKAGYGVQKNVKYCHTNMYKNFFTAKKGRERKAEKYIIVFCIFAAL